MTAPRYTGVQREAIPAIPAIAAAENKATVNLISGVWRGHAGPIASLTGVFMTRIDMQAGACLDFGELAGRNLFVYLVAGVAVVNGTAISQHTLVELDLSGDALRLETDAGARFLFGHGDPISETVVAYGPFVMNTELEIRQAIADYQAGKFGPALD